MSLRENQFRTKNIRKSAPGKYPNARDGRSAKSTVSERLPKFSFNNDKVTKILGLFALLLSLYFLIAFTSYLFTWQDDQSYISSSNGGWGNLFKSSEELRVGFEEPVVDNWLGKFGALLSHQFIYKWFGIASFIFVALLFVIGYRLLFKVAVYPLNKTFGYSIFFLLFISIGVAYFHGFASNFPHFIEGEIGFWSNRLLQAQIGRAGVGGLLLFSALTFLIIVYNLDFKFLRSSLSSDIQSKEVNEEPSKPISINRDFKSEEVELNPKLNVVKETQPKNNNVQKAPAFEIEREDEPLVVESQPVISKNEVIKPSPALSVEDVVEEKKADANVLVEKFGQYDPKLDLSSYKYPHLGLLKDYGSGKITINNYELEANKDKIVDTLGNYNIEIEKIKATIGPTVTLYEIIPKPGVRISKIKNLEDDIALSLAALGIRIIAPMPGKGTIGIEVPNSHPEMVSMYSVLATEKFQHTDMDLPIALGKTISNEVFIADLAKMPHLLVAGATGQGKSVGINAILTSLLFKKHPSELKFVLVDPK
jgi:S-DNA-T family DNA segregation ATPase FtsK/SpoIIIE